MIDEHFCLSFDPARSGILVPVLYLCLYVLGTGMCDRSTGRLQWNNSPPVSMCMHLSGGQSFSLPLSVRGSAKLCHVYSNILVVQYQYTILTIHANLGTWNHGYVPFPLHGRFGKDHESNGSTRFQRTRFFPSFSLLDFLARSPICRQWVSPSPFDKKKVDRRLL